MWRQQYQAARAGVARQLETLPSPRGTRTWLLYSSGTNGGLPARDSKALVDSDCNFREFDHCSPGMRHRPPGVLDFFVAQRLQGQVA